MPATTPDEALEAFFDAFNQGDIEKMMVFYEPRPVMVSQPGLVAEGQAAVREALKLFLAMKPTMTRRDHTAVIAGDLALLIVK
jgi:ketosteroid isomerase-like protein